MTDELLDGEQLKTIIENQLEEGNPIRVKETLMRLVMTGTERSDAIELMACAMGLEMEAMVTSGNAFDLDSYCKKLDQLPDAPWLADIIDED
ncbi:hypothetical protein [Parendozoicomonas haliclonae]|uniref:Uncharacterized protein n=1 Tax=Parendozoicomonas haliclonae TaxID=1960125 RepID=A0A1X7ANW5_9GAMM|nr:hypothetical protein [Parendozoicomonas haliclonae]SMA49833.1 hypothetical protein EHSB41UT_03623 [Parendozoicomonas haliclonae]